MIEIGKVIAAMLLIVAAKVASAAEPSVIVLACDGMMTMTVGEHQSAPQPVNKVGVVVDLTEGTVSFAGSVAHIDGVDTAVISFGTDDVLREEVPHRATGVIYRVTGAMSAATINGAALSSYELACKAAGGVF